MSPDEAASAQPKSATPKARAPDPGEPEAQAVDAGLVAVTVEVASGRIVDIERVDAAGARHSLARHQAARLTDGPAAATLQRLFEAAFEAGLDCALGEETEETDAGQSDEDAELSRMLLRSLLQHSGAGRLMQPDVLSRAIVGTLIEDAAALSGAAPH
ncbi:MAG: hypothetical protein ACJ798_02870 [Phenylobacterium sp.]